MAGAGRVHRHAGDTDSLPWKGGPAWHDPGRKIEMPVAKAMFVRTQNFWRIYWRRADLKWHIYDPLAEAPGISRFLAEVEADPHGCFWG